MDNTKKLRYVAFWFDPPTGDNLFWNKHEEAEFSNKKDLKKWMVERPGSKYVDRHRYGHKKSKNNS